MFKNKFENDKLHNKVRQVLTCQWLKLLKIKGLWFIHWNRSVIKRPTDSTTSTTNGQTDTTSGQTSTTSGQTNTTNGQTSTTSR